MTRGPRNAARGKGASGATAVSPAASSPDAAPIDLGIALSVYGKTPQGELVEIQEASAASSAAEVSPTFDTWPTKQ